jgi:thiosulfate/3-mercaptopyruvate sulfurtransferase
VIAPFVDIEWVRAHLAKVVLADCRWYTDGRSGRDAYAAGHIPGAVFVDLDTALTRHEDPALGGRHPLAEPGDFAAAMAALGIGDDDTVIAYDDAGGVIAARLVWMLRVTGHEAALLDGGLGAWEDELETGEAPAVVLRPGPAPAVDLRPGSRAKGRPQAEARAEGRPRGGEPTVFTPRPWPMERLASIDEVAELAAGGGTVIDARPADRFAGAPDDLDPRPGHIPGARSVPCRENLDSTGKLLPVADLRARFAVEDAAEVISSCGSGVTACHNLLAMEQAGLGDGGRLFPGSWSQWSRDPARPVQNGDGSPR